MNYLHRITFTISLPFQCAQTLSWSGCYLDDVELGSNPQFQGHFHRRAWIGYKGTAHNFRVFFPQHDKYDKTNHINLKYGGLFDVIRHTFCRASQVTQLIKNHPANAEDVGLIPGSGRFWRRKWQPTPVFLPGKSHGQEEPSRLQSIRLQPSIEPWALLAILLGMTITRYFSSSHVRMWELDHKESWELKNWLFRTMVLEKTLESPLDSKEIKPVHPKGN